MVINYQNVYDTENRTDIFFSHWNHTVISVKYIYEGWSHIVFSPLLFKDTKIKLKLIENFHCFTFFYFSFNGFFSVTLDFQCAFQCHNCIVIYVYW